MRASKAHAAAVAVALLALIVIALGALLTSETRALPGATDPALAVVTTAPGLQSAHQIAGYVLVALTLGLAILASNTAGWLALGASILEAVLGGVPVVHALLAPIYFSLVVATAVLTSKSWRSPAAPVESPWKPLRPLAVYIAPLLIVMQIGLGAAFRHNAMGVLSHILNALIVLVVVLIAGIFVVRQFPDHPALRPAALGFLIIAGIQVLLGFSVYLVLLMSSENNMGLIVTGVLHLTNGALTLAASVVFAMQTGRNLKSQTGK
ncbi:MAG TPA: hypothetical protein VG297_05025 [Bryobacteraceae bacterium]|jgi:heme A synthase|nr:hypothetical protein [Bryobacteraceae bacterium]